MDRSFLDLANLLFVGCVCLFIAPLRQVIFPGAAYALRSETASAAPARLLVYDIARGCAIIAVIVIHIAELILTGYPGAEPAPFFYLNNVSRFAIALFVICSGLLLSPQDMARQSIGHFWLPKLFRIFIPYGICCAVVALWHHWSFAEFLFALCTGNAAKPYYFVVVLAGLYLAYPFLLRLKNRRLLLPLAFGISALSYATFYGWSIALIPLPFRYLYFFCYGISLRQTLLQGAPSAQSRIAAIAIIGVYLFGAVFFSAEYFNVQLLYGPAVFTVILSLRTQLEANQAMHWFGSTIGRASLWIFLLHYAIVQLFRDMCVTWHLPPGWAAGCLLAIALPVSVGCGVMAARVYGVVAARLRPESLADTTASLRNN